MAFFSNIGGARTPIIDSSNAQAYAQVSERGRGYMARPYETHPFGAVGYAKPRRAQGPPREEWPELIKRKEKAEASLGHLWRYAKLEILDQQQTNYCWMFGVIAAYHIARAKNNLPKIILSPASCAAKIKNFRNVGGWGGEAIEGINVHGACDSKYWPQAAIDRQYDTPESRENAKLHGVAEWDELRPQSFEELAWSLLDDFACPIGHIWWGHLVCHIRLVQIGSNEFGTEFANSWGPDWETNGFGVMHEEKATPDEGNALRVITPSLA